MQCLITVDEWLEISRKRHQTQIQSQLDLTVRVGLLEEKLMKIEKSLNKYYESDYQSDIEELENRVEELENRMDEKETETEEETETEDIMSTMTDKKWDSIEHVLQDKEIPKAIKEILNSNKCYKQGFVLNISETKKINPIIWKDFVNDKEVPYGLTASCMCGDVKQQFCVPRPIPLIEGDARIHCTKCKNKDL